MKLEDAKYVSMVILFASNLIMTLIGIGLQRFLSQYKGNILSHTQHVISCLTSGILLGTLLMLILPNSLNLISHHWHDNNMGYILIGVGFFLICFIKELINLCETYPSKKQSKIEKEQLINLSTVSNGNNELTRLITLVFALGVHYFFSGILIGGQTKDIGTLWVLVGAICFHMSLVAFSATLRLLIDNENYIRVFFAMCIWSLMGPLGVYVSLLTSTNTEELTIINGILQCLSAGTFVYITFIDMIHDDLVTKKFYPFVNILMIFGGFLLIVITTAWHKHGY